MPNNNWDADDTVRFLAWGSATIDARERWRQAQYETHGINPEDKKTKKRWADGDFTDTEKSIFTVSDDLYFKALNDLPGIIHSHEWTVTGRKKDSALREPIPLIFWQSADIDPLGEDGGEAHPTIGIEEHKHAAIFTKGFDKGTWVGLRFKAAEVRALATAKAIQEQGNRKERRPSRGRRKRRSDPYFHPMRKALTELAEDFTLDVVDHWTWAERREHISRKIQHDLPGHTRFAEVYNVWYSETAKKRENVNTGSL